MNVTITHADFVPGARVLAVSDIHGHADRLRRVLALADYAPGEDYLVIVGDIIEKGPACLDALHTVMALDAASDRVYVLAGNVDLWRVNGILDDSGDNDEWLYRNVTRFRDRWGSSLFTDMCAEAGISYDSLAGFSAARSAIAHRFAEELHYLAARPTILDTPHYCFVHGGLPCPLDAIDSLTAVDPFACLKYDDFLGDLAARGAGRFPRPVIVGHWPAILYRHAIPSLDPYLDATYNVYSIDGGTGVKREGQLNCLILEGDRVSHVAVDELTTVTAREAQAPSTDPLTIVWGDNAIRRLDAPAPAGYAAIEHIRTGRRLCIPDDYFYEEDGELYCQDVTDYALPVEPGDLLRVIKTMPDGVLAKCHGVIGWYRGQYG